LTDETLDELQYSTDGRRVSLALSEDLYPLDAIYGAAYLFVDRCWMFLTRPADKALAVRLTPKQEGADLEALAGEFANELLNQVLRFRLAESTGPIREYVMARAFSMSPAQASIDQLLAELEAEELDEDPLEIAVPWEQKNGEAKDG